MTQDSKKEEYIQVRRILRISGAKKFDLFLQLVPNCFVKGLEIQDGQVVSAKEIDAKGAIDFARPAEIDISKIIDN